MKSCSDVKFLESLGWVLNATSPSISFYNPTSRSPLVLQRERAALVAICKKHSRNGRFLFHSSPSDHVHIMVVCEFKTMDTGIHRHPEPKSESFSVLEGALLVELFGTGGELMEGIHLGIGDTLMIEDFVWHRVSARSDYCVYLEAKRGPFNKSIDSEMMELP